MVSQLVVPRLYFSTVGLVRGADTSSRRHVNRELMEML